MPLCKNVKSDGKTGGSRLSEGTYRVKVDNLSMPSGDKDNFIVTKLVDRNGSIAFCNLFDNSSSLKYFIEDICKQDCNKFDSLEDVVVERDKFIGRNLKIQIKQNGKYLNVVELFEVNDSEKKEKSNDTTDDNNEFDDDIPF